MATSMKMMYRILSLLFLAGKIILADEEFEGLTRVPVEHTFDEGLEPTFIQRGVINIKSFKAGGASFIQEDILINQEKEQLKALVRKNGVYRIRIPSRKLGGVQRYVATYVPACALYESKLSDHLTLNVDQSGNLFSVSMTTLTPHCHGLKVSDSELSRFNTSVEVVQTVAGPVPDTQTYIQKMEQEAAERAKGQQADNRSFLAKYWMYLVPLVIFLMVASNADQGQGGN